MAGRSIPRVIATIALMLAPAGASAQVRASEPAKVAQTIDGTTITIEYSRPVARGRTGLFGDVVHWDIPWTPGANWATTLEVDRDVRISGHDVPQGKYSVWMIPQENAEWTVILNRSARRFHTQKPDSMEDLVRFRVRPEQRPHEEVLTWSFPAVASEGATLRMQWGTTAVPLRVTVTPSDPVLMSEAELAPYTGTYAMEVEGGPQGGIRFELYFEDGLLQGRFEPPPPGRDAQIQLLPAGRDRFHAGFFRNGELFEIEAETLLQFHLESGRATRFDFIFLGNAYATARRVR